MTMPEPSADEQFYHLSDSERAFLKIETGIHNEDELKEHVMSMAKAAMAVHPYPCIRRLGFIRLKMTRNPEAYEHVLNLGRTVPGAILIELGCCFGNDVRQIARAGFPSENILASDLRGGFWDVSQKLYANPPTPFKGAFLAGDVNDPEFLSILPQLESPPTEPAPALKSLTSLNPLHGHVSAIHTGSFFHLFNFEVQLEVARKFAGILSPRPGSIIFGCHGSFPTKGIVRASGTNKMYCHSVESWTEMWEGVFSGKDKVEIKAWMTNSGKVLNPETDFWMLYWSVKRL
ncbi:hypothetical protein MKEN_01384500 [Mycena kentingensis (nom. inval.)]|nr:hypothetical protein MKEN_01384500 [Mycena kentingensis (nom. inval.)]